jgi:hypothetical protein
MYRKLNTDPSAFKSFMGGVLSADGEEIYYIAIIDILTQYVFKKKGERLLKSFIHDAVRRDPPQMLFACACAVCACAGCSCVKVRLITVRWRCSPGSNIGDAAQAVPAAVPEVCK